ERNKRRALAAGGDVRAPKVGDRRHPCPQRDPRRVAELEGGPPREMCDGLPVHRDDVRKCGKRRNERDRGVGVRVADRHMQGGELRGGERVPGSGGEDAPPEVVVVVVMACRDNLDLVAVDVDRGNIDPIHRRPGHHSDRDHRRIVARQGLASAWYTATRKRPTSSSLSRPKYTRFVRRTSVRSFAGSTHTLVPVNPVCPNASSLKNGRPSGGRSTRPMPRRTPPPRYASVRARSRSSFPITAPSRQTRISEATSA